jgi:flavorubredoxin
MMQLANEAKFEVHEPTLEVKYIPTKEELEKCVEFGKEIASKII